ncbi:MAG: serine--tRNA ligase [Candidatus Diapherotrites archaeon]
MLDIKLIRETPKIIARDLKKRGQNNNLKLLEKIKIEDDLWRKLKYDVDKLKQRRNELTNEIKNLKSQGKNITQKLKDAKEIPNKIKQNETKADEIYASLTKALMRLPNILDESVPIGKDEEDNLEIRKFGNPPKLDFEMMPHGQFIEEKGLADFKRAAKTSGSGFFYLYNDLTLLNLALINFASEFLMKKGYCLTEVPLMMRRMPYEGVTDLDDFENVMYKIEDEDLYLIATSEHPLAAMHMNETLDTLPLKYAGISQCFRKEIGKHGVDTRGLHRVHQFSKIEQFIFCKPEDSQKYHEELLSNLEFIFKKLELPYRVVNVCTGDIGTVASKKYDLDVWSPRENKYFEAASCSNCTSYQSNRLNIKYQTQDGKQPVHTLNSTAIATSRAIRAIIENHQTKKGTIKIPKALHPYMNGKKAIG